MGLRLFGLEPLKIFIFWFWAKVLLCIIRSSIWVPGEVDRCGQQYTQKRSTWAFQRPVIGLVELVECDEGFTWNSIHRHNPLRFSPDLLNESLFRSAGVFNEAVLLLVQMLAESLTLSPRELAYQPCVTRIASRVAAAHRPLILNAAARDMMIVIVECIRRVPLSGYNKSSHTNDL